eukprot:GILK01033227.1.p1 GENE.GILK01033227.1~~GILK01033227.1.p1  ORF type:complete len:102 (-),score=13.27 GILK01033227.1:236-508(-)
MDPIVLNSSPKSHISDEHKEVPAEVTAKELPKELERPKEHYESAAALLSTAMAEAIAKIDQRRDPVKNVIRFAVDVFLVLVIARAVAMLF